MTTLTLLPDPDYGRVRCSIVDAQGGDLVRTDPAGTWLVRGGQGLTGALLVDDYDAPFGVPITYAIEDSGDQPTQLDPTTGPSWITHPTDAANNMAVTVFDTVDVAYDAPGEVHHILDSAWPVAVYTPRNVHTGVLAFWTPWEDRHQTEQLLASGSPLLLRTTPDCLVDDMWFWAARVTRTKMGTDPYLFNGLRWELEYQKVAPPTDAYLTDPSNSYDGVLLTFATYDELAATHATYNDLATTPHP